MTTNCRRSTLAELHHLTAVEATYLPVKFWLALIGIPTMGQQIHIGYRSDDQIYLLYLLNLISLHGLRLGPRTSYTHETAIACSYSGHYYFHYNYKYQYIAHWI